MIAASIAAGCTTHSKLPSDYCGIDICTAEGDTPRFLACPGKPWDMQNQPPRHQHPCRIPAAYGHNAGNATTPSTARCHGARPRMVRNR